MSIIKLEASWSGEEDAGIRSPCSDQMQNSPTSSQSSTSGDGDLENIGSPVAQPGRRKLKRRRKRMLTGVSRQRRAANERERRRIQGVNRAFLELKNALPVADNVDISKIDILRVATKWIDHLTKLLDQDQRIAIEPTNYHDIVEPQLYELLGEEFSINERELEDDDFLQGQVGHSNILGMAMWRVKTLFIHLFLFMSPVAILVAKVVFTQHKVKPRCSYILCILCSAHCTILNELLFIEGASGCPGDVEDIWSDTSGELCVHIEEPYLQTLLYNSFQSDTLTSPLLELTDRL